MRKFVYCVCLIVGLLGTSTADHDRDHDLRVCQHLCGPVCDMKAACIGSCTNRCIDAKANVTRPGKLSPWITFNGAIQHVGLTTSNLSRSVDFYTTVMGGVEVLSAGGDGWKGNDVYQLLMQAALIRGGVVASWAADLSNKGAETLAARYIAFDNVVIELLDYHSTEAVLQRALQSNTAKTFPMNPEVAVEEDLKRFPKFSASTVAPSVVGNMHISFNVREDKDLNAFVTALETTAHDSGFEQVYCNRLVPVGPLLPNGHPNVSNIPAKDNSYLVTSGAFEGWSLAYCKGPDGEQLEFNKVTGNATKDFDQALRTYLTGGTNPKW